MQQASCKDDTTHTLQNNTELQCFWFSLKLINTAELQVFYINVSLNSAFSEVRQLEDKKATTSSKAAAVKPAVLRYVQVN